jgi:hypothetical protein
MNELLREIEDDINREKLDRLWRHLGKIMIGVSLIVVAATIIMVIMQNQKQSQAMEQTDRFVKGIDQARNKNYEGALAAFSSLTNDPGSPYFGIAMLRKAEAQETSGNNAGASATYQALAAHGGAFGELAEMRNDNNKMVVTSKNMPFYYSESEWKGWQLLKAGKKDEAKAQFVALRDSIDAPYSLRQRMQQVVSAMGGDDTAKKDEQKK